MCVASMQYGLDKTNVTMPALLRIHLSLEVTALFRTVLSERLLSVLTYSSFLRSPCCFELWLAYNLPYASASSQVLQPYALAMGGEGAGPGPASKDLVQKRKRIRPAPENWRLGLGHTAPGSPEVAVVQAPRRNYFCRRN